MQFTSGCFSPVLYFIVHTLGIEEYRIGMKIIVVVGIYTTKTIQLE